MAADGPEKTTFGELIAEGALEIGDGYRAKNEELGGDGVMFLRAGHVRDTHIDFTGIERFFAGAEARVRSKLAKPGDTIVTTKGNSTGRTSFVSASMPQFVYSPHLSYWRSLKPSRVVGGFLRYWSRSEEFANQLAGMKASTDMAPYLSLIDQKRLRITLPPANQQRAIAHILGTLDDKIELNRRMSETLEAMARALFKSWFVDFDPVRAKAEGRDPGLPKHLADLFPSRLVDSELGEIPEGWRIDQLGDHVVNLDSQRVPLSGSVRAGRKGRFPYHGAADVMDFIDDYLFDGVHVLVGEDGSVVREGGLAVTQYAWGRFWVNNHAHVLKGRGSVSTEQILLYFQHVPVESYVTGAVQPKLSQGRMNLMPFVFAGDELCASFSRLAEPFFSKVRAATDESLTLSTLRDSLLPRLVSGDLPMDQANQIDLGSIK